MRLDGIHHVTCITGDAPRNVEFYTRVLGLRLVKKSVNQDDPTVYHLLRGRARESRERHHVSSTLRGAGVRAGMIHTVGWRVASDEALGVLGGAARPGDDGARARRGGLVFEDPEGLRHRLVVSTVSDEPLVAEHPEVPAELALQGFDGGKRCSCAPGGEPGRPRGHPRLHRGDCPRQGTVTRFRLGSQRPGSWQRVRAYDEPPAERGLGGGALCTMSPGRRRWTTTAPGNTGHLGRPAPVADHRPLLVPLDLFREPSGVSPRSTLGPLLGGRGLEHLGEALVLPPAFEHLRGQLEPILTPLPEPRPWARTS